MLAKCSEQSRAKHVPNVPNVPHVPNVPNTNIVPVQDRSCLGAHSTTQANLTPKKLFAMLSRCIDEKNISNAFVSTY